MSTCKILIIEDHPLNMELAADVLEAHGCVVFKASSAEIGLGLARDTVPDLVLMDLSLPGMDGWAAARALKSDPQTQHLPLVALTAHAMKGDREAAMQAGFDAYIAKPIDTRTFAATVLASIPNHRILA
jgi:CheY-like chemotaxis protein